MQLPLVTVVALGVVLAALAAVRSRFVRARLAFAAVLLVAAAALDVAVGRGGGDPVLLAGLARLSIVAAGVLAAVSLAFNPWRQNRPSDRVPAIVQDVIVIALFAVATTLLLDEKLLTTSAVGAVVIGLRAAGHARQPLCRPRHPDREAVPRRPLDPRRRATRARCRR